MDYEKKFKESMAKMSAFLAKHNGFTISKDGEMYKELSEIFPELAESDDEKIRKSLIETLNGMHSATFPLRGFSREQYITYLEKQGEQKPMDNVELKFKVGDIIKKKDTDVTYTITNLMNDKYRLNNQSSYLPFEGQDAFELVEQKPVELDEKDRKTIETAIKVCQGNGFSETAIYLKDLKDRCLPQPKQEWSEEDRKIIIELIGIFESAIDGGHVSFPYRLIKDYIRVLKSCLSQSIWKPSEEQMVVLNDVIINGHLSNANERILKGLQEQLQNL